MPFFSSHQTQRRGSASHVTLTTHRFHPHAEALALPGQVDARLSAGGTVITRARVFAPPVGFPAGPTANLDAVEPPNGRDALVTTQHAAPARALILTLWNEWMNECRLSATRFISRSSMNSPHLLVAPVTAFAGRLGLPAGFSPQVEGSEWRRGGALDTVKVHRHAARAGCASFAARSRLSACLASVDAFFGSPAFISALSTRPGSGG